MWAWLLSKVLPRALPWIFKPWVMVAIGLSILFGYWQVDRYRQFNAGLKAGEKQIIEKSVEKGKANAAKSKKAHTAAKQPGAFERLRKDPMVCGKC